MLENVMKCRAKIFFSTFSEPLGLFFENAQARLARPCCKPATLFDNMELADLL